MKLRTLSNVVAIALLGVSLAACGGSKTSTSTTTQQTVATPNNGAEVPMGAMAPVNVNCGAVKPVWVNLSSKAYHEPGDPWYGRSKHGQYMCPSQAAAQGYHPAGARHKGMQSGYGGGAKPGYETGTMPPSMRHHRRGMESPSPDATP